LTAPTRSASSSFHLPCALGYVGDLRDPLDVLLKRTTGEVALGDPATAAARLRER